MLVGWPWVADTHSWLEPTALAVTVIWRTDRGERRSREIHHDLAAYRDFPYLEVPDDA